MANPYPIAVIGAGASGLMAAIAAARVRPHSVILLEKEARVGRKLLATGNGRCNLLNMHIREDAYHGSGRTIALGFAKQKPPEALIAFLNSIGLCVREEAAGRCYPYSGQASSVLDALRNACDRLSVEVCLQATVSSIQKTPHGFMLHGKDFAPIPCERVIFATGGKAAPSFGTDGSAFAMMTSLGHTVMPLRPALAPLKLPPDRIRGLKGIRLHCLLSLEVNGSITQTEQGEILFTDYGISGVAAMQLARAVGDALAMGQRVHLIIRLMDHQAAKEQVALRTALFKGQQMESFCMGLLPSRIAQCLLREAGIAKDTPVSMPAAQPLVSLLSGWSLPVLGILPFQHAQVTAGGLSLDAFDATTLASRLIPGLYACGEALDVDGDCGGYNLMWAWLSGIVAGEAAANSL